MGVLPACVAGSVSRWAPLILPWTECGVRVHPGVVGPYGVPPLPPGLLSFYCTLPRNLVWESSLPESLHTASWGDSWGCWAVCGWCALSFSPACLFPGLVAECSCPLPPRDSPKDRRYHSSSWMSWSYYEAWGVCCRHFHGSAHHAVGPSENVGPGFAAY